jgi:hypothetical protein
LKEWSSFLSRCADECAEGLRPLKLVSATERFLILTHCRAIEIATAFNNLALVACWTGAELCVRPLVEGLADTKLIAAQDSHVKSMDLASKLEWKRMLEAASAGGNPFLEEIRKADLEKGILEQLKTDIEKLKAAGHVKLTAKDKFEKAGLNDLYASVFALTCNYVHGNQTALLSSHMELIDGSYVVSLFKGRDKGHQLLMFDTVQGLLLKSAEIVHQRLTESTPSWLALLFADLEALRKKHN